MAGKRRNGSHDDRRLARRRALQALYQWHMTGQTASEILKQFIEEQDMAKVDVGYFETLLTDVITRSKELDQRIGEAADRELRRVDPLELAVLRLAAYELLHRPEIPYRVVLDQAVDLAKSFGSDQSPVYVNGVLDRCAREWRSVEIKHD
jgi:N utilization substance protein B